MSENNKNNEDIQCLRNWLKKQLHLPQKIEDNFLLRFLQSSQYSTEKTKQLIDLCFTLRSQAPEIFANRDPFTNDIAQVFKSIDFAPLPKPTVNNNKILVYRLRDKDVDNFRYADSLKVFFMVADVRMSTEHAQTTGEVPIFDMANVTLRHLTRISLAVLNKYMVYTQEAHPVRLKEIHIVNTNSFLDKCMTLMRPFLKSDVAKLLHFHTPNSNTLYEFVPRELLPLEYGGTLPSLEVIKNDWMQRVMDHRNFFLDEERWRVDETLRPSGNDKNQSAKEREEHTGIQGSFRCLQID